MAINNHLSSREEMQMLTFSLDNVLYGVNVSQVREVKNFEGVTPVPYAPIYVSNDYLEELEEILRRPVLVTGDPLLHPEKWDLA